MVFDQRDAGQNPAHKKKEQIKVEKESINSATLASDVRLWETLILNMGGLKAESMILGLGHHECSCRW